MMEFSIRNRRRNPYLESYVRDRLLMALDCFGAHVSHVDVGLFGESGDRRGTQKVCTLDINLDPLGRLHVRAKQEDVRSAVAKAIQRAQVVIAKSVSPRHRDRSRSPHEHRDGDVQAAMFSAWWEVSERTSDN